MFLDGCPPFTCIPTAVPPLPQLWTRPEGGAPRASSAAQERVCLIPGPGGLTVGNLSPTPGLLGTAPLDLLSAGEALTLKREEATYPGSLLRPEHFKCVIRFQL